MKWLFLFLLIVPVTKSEEILLQYKGQILDKLSRTEFELYPIGETMINDSKLEQLMDVLNEKIKQTPENAKLDEHGKIVAEQNGEILDRKGFKEKFYEFFFERQVKSSLTVPTKPLYPKVDSELLSRITTTRVSHYVTYFNSQNKERTHNIKLAAEAINNYVVFPGEIFSFNKVVGKRTKSKGYMKAPIIVRGELSEGVGGGICQVSSTLFNAVDQAGVTIVERYTHSRRVPYVPPKRDATVSWYGPDFSFKNNHNQPLFIRSKVYGGQLIIKILSSDALDYNRKEVPSAPHKLPAEVNTEENQEVIH